jgi:hypothetical protein
MLKARSPREDLSAPRDGVCKPRRLRVHPTDDPGRSEVEAFIRRIYADRYGAELECFAPVLVSLCDEDGLVAAAGYRDASRGRLFLERYLDAPVESLLATQAGAAPRRGGIVEVGHLVAED